MDNDNTAAVNAGFISRAFRVSRFTVREWFRAGKLKAVGFSGNTNRPLFNYRDAERLCVGLSEKKKSVEARKDKAEERKMASKAIKSLAKELGLTVSLAKTYINRGMPPIAESAMAWVRSTRALATKTTADMCGISPDVVRIYRRKLLAPRHPECFWLWYLARAARRAKSSADAKQRRNEKQRMRDYARRKRPEVKARMRELRKKYRASGQLKAWEANSRGRPEERVKRALRRRLQHAVFSQKTKRRFTTVQSIGCSPADLRKWIEAQFSPGMTWDNYGKVWEIDHIFPISKFNLSDPSEQLRANHFRNLRPLWKWENQKKRDTVPKSFQPLLIAA